MGVSVRDVSETSTDIFLPPLFLFLLTLLPVSEPNPLHSNQWEQLVKVQHRAWSLVGAHKASVEMHGWESPTLEYFSTQREGC